MFRRTTNREATSMTATTETPEADVPARFTPDNTGAYVAALDCPEPDRHLASPALLHRLIGWQHEAQGGDPLPVVLTHRGTARTIGAREPHALVARDAEREFDLRAWKGLARAELRDQHEQARTARLRKSLEAGLRRLIVTSNTESVTADRDRRQLVLAELVSQGLCRQDGNVWVLAKETTVDLRYWPYLDAGQTARYTPAASRALDVLVYQAVDRAGNTIPAGRYRVLGHLEASDGTRLPVFLIPSTRFSAKPSAIAANGVWEEVSRTLTVDVTNWVKTKQAQASREATGPAAVQAATPGMLVRLKRAKAVRPATKLDQLTLDALARDGWCYEVDGSFVLCREA